METTTAMRTIRRLAISTAVRASVGTCLWLSSLRAGGIDQDVVRAIAFIMTLATVRSAASLIQLLSESKAGVGPGGWSSLIRGLETLRRYIADEPSEILTKPAEQTV